ncbi:MAG TPA: mobilization protein [Ktedonobacteraceae bacterium]|nr:mobilization protein [Ktedonobacteraceae bacterium]
MESERVKKLKEQKRVIEERLRKQQNRDRTKERKDDTRRKILAGAWLLDEMNQRNDFKEFVYKKLDSFLSRPADRALFGLSPLKNNEEGQ